MNIIQQRHGVTPPASRILWPGNRALPPGVERYRVKGMGSLSIRVSEGDRITLTDIEGGQRCEVSLHDKEARFAVETTSHFGPETRAGESQQFTVSHDGTLIVAVPGTPMDLSAQNTATDIELRITRAKPVAPGSGVALPEPLADVLQDIRIGASTARAYTL